jgi:hypothetical protein
MRVAIELLLLLIEDDNTSQRTTHEVLGVKFILLSLINVEIQSQTDFDEQYVQDCLWVVLNTCIMSHQGAIDLAEVNGTELLLYLCESRPSLAFMSLKIIRLLVVGYRLHNSLPQITFN